MYTVIETPIYSKKVTGILTQDQRENLSVYLSINPNVGVVVKGSDGIRKVRWAISNKGKSGGVRVIYFTRLDIGRIYLLTLYAKNERANIPAHELKIIRKAIENGN